MARWTARVSGFEKAEWRTPAETAKDAVVVGEKMPTSPGLQPMWDSAGTSVDSLVDLLAGLGSGGDPRHYEIEVTVTEEEGLLSVLLWVTYRT